MPEGSVRKPDDEQNEWVKCHIAAGAVLLQLNAN